MFFLLKVVRGGKRLYVDRRGILTEEVVTTTQLWWSPEAIWKDRRWQHLVLPTDSLVTVRSYSKTINDPTVPEHPRPDISKVFNVN